VFESSMVGVFNVDATFLTDTSKFISDSLLALSAMIALELPRVNVHIKCDLIDEEDIDRTLSIESASYKWNLEQYDNLDRMHKRYRLTEAISSLLDDYTMVSFLPLNIHDEDSMKHVQYNAAKIRKCTPGTVLKTILLMTIPNLTD
jgi:GPN-loop GTPase